MICNAEAVSVEAAAAEFAGKVAFVGVAWGGDPGHFQQFVDRHALTFPQIADSPGDVFARFGILRQPAAVIVAADGDVRTLTGRADGETISAVLAGREG